MVWARFWVGSIKLRRRFNLKEINLYNNITIMNVSILSTVFL
jgi:hypothetical protein